MLVSSTVTGFSHNFHHSSQVDELECSEAEIETAAIDGMNEQQERE